MIDRMQADGLGARLWHLCESLRITASRLNPTASRSVKLDGDGDTHMFRINDWNFSGTIEYVVGALLVLTIVAAAFA